MLQHERERRHAFGTVRLLKVALANLVVHRMPKRVHGTYLMPQGFPSEAGMLYPGPGSIDLATLSPSEMPAKLVVIDGTWSQAHCMVRDSPLLQQLPRYCLNPTSPSRYRIRKEPRRECLSTLESTAMALRLIEPQTEGIDNLLRTFECMVDRQLARILAHEGSAKRTKTRRERPMRAVPASLWMAPSRVVVLYGESALPRSEREQQHRALAQWSALRMTNPEEVFDGIVGNTGHEGDESSLPCGFFLKELEWSSSDLERAETMNALRSRWRKFIRPGDVLVAWSKGTARLAVQHGLASEVLVLKDVYGNTRAGNVGSLEKVVKREQLSVCEALVVAGRGRVRLARAQAAALYLVRWARRLVLNTPAS